MFVQLGISHPLCSPIGDAMKLTFHRGALLRCIVTSLLLCFFLLLAAAQQEDQPIIRFVRNPDPAPDFQLAGLDGKPVTLAGSKGKVVLVNFWATWCGPCRAEIPDLVELQKKYKDRLQILGLVVDDEDLDAIKKFAARFGINYPVALATNDIRIQYGGIPALPTSFVLDSEGRVVQKHEGLRDPVLYEAEIRSLLGLPIGNVKVETFEDVGETPEQKTVALHKFNAESCTCGCSYTLAQCRIYDRDCKTSKAATEKIIAAAVGSHAAPTPAAPSQSTSPVASPSPEKPHE
ncbi:MAG: hypothetical protein AUG13_06500 [Chloroflexi bacterium 13_1_20CM_2_59_7]|nr:MAG: hypothetical protein AUG13_06500 [Chloroflexi bacterium 13_1_20CM_2_59_7]